MVYPKSMSCAKSKYLTGLVLKMVKILFPVTAFCETTEFQRFLGQLSSAKCTLSVNYRWPLSNRVFDTGFDWEIKHALISFWGFALASL